MTAIQADSASRPRSAGQHSSSQRRRRQIGRPARRTATRSRQPRQPQPPTRTVASWARHRRDTQKPPPVISRASHTATVTPLRASPAVPEAGWYPADTGNGTSYYDPRYNDAANHTAGAGETSPSGTVAGAADPGYGGDGYASADYYGSYGGSAYQGGYPAPLAANGYTGGATQGGQPDPASYQASGQFAGHYDQRAIAAPDPAYGHDGYQGYPGYGGNGR